MARVLRASRSGFYAWLARQREPSSRQQARQTRDAQVLAAFNRAKQRYGAPRLLKPPSSAVEGCVMANEVCFRQRGDMKT